MMRKTENQKQTKPNFKSVTTSLKKEEINN